MQKNSPTDPETYQDLGQQLHRLLCVFVSLWLNYPRPF